MRTVFSNCRMLIRLFHLAQVQRFCLILFSNIALEITMWRIFLFIFFFFFPLLCSVVTPTSRMDDPVVVKQACFCDERIICQIRILFWEIINGVPVAAGRLRLLRNMNPPRCVVVTPGGPEEATPPHRLSGHRRPHPQSVRSQVPHVASSYI